MPVNLNCTYYMFQLCCAPQREQQEYLRELDSFRSANESLQAELTELKRRTADLSREETSPICPLSIVRGNLTVPSPPID